MTQFNCTGKDCKRRKTCKKHVILRSGNQLFDPPDNPDDCDIYEQISENADSNPLNKLNEQTLKMIIGMLAWQSAYRKRAVELNSKAIAERTGVSQSMVYEVKNKFHREIGAIARDIVLDY